MNAGAARGCIAQVDIALGTLDQKLVRCVEHGGDTIGAHYYVTASGDKNVVRGDRAAFNYRLNDVRRAGPADANDIVGSQDAEAHISLYALRAEQAVVIGLSRGSDRCVGG